MEDKKTGAKVVEVLFFPNGTTAVTENQKQVPELQISWFKLFVEFLEKNNVDVINSKFLIPGFNGWKEAKFSKTENGYNWSFE